MILDLLPSNLKEAYAKHYFDDKKRRAFYLKVAELLSNGVKTDDIVASMYLRAQKRNKNSVDTWIYKQMMSGLASTGSLSQGTKKFIPSIDQVLIRSGEQSGQLEKTLLAAADLNEKTSKMKTLIRKALAYPCFVVIMVIVIMCWFASSIFPTMADFVPVERWPGISQNAFKIGQFMLNWYWVIAAALCGLFVLIFYSFANLTGPIRIKLDKIPPWSLYRLTQGGAWIMSVSSMVASGTINVDALNIVYKESKGNRWLQERTRAVRDNISKGQNMGDALTTKFNFPDEELCDDMGDYAKSGNFNAIFEKVGKEWIETGVIRVEEQSKKMNGIAMGLTMGVICWMIMAVLRLMMTVADTMSASSFQ